MKKQKLEQEWLRFQSNVAAGKQQGIASLGLPVGASDHRAFTGLPTAAEKSVQNLLQTWSNRYGNQNEKETDSISEEKKIFTIGMRFLECADRCRADEFHELLVAGVPVNFQHPRTLLTALHYTTTQNAANELTRELMAHPDIDLLIRDQFGRQPWNNAEFFGIEPDLAEALREATALQAQSEGIDVFGEYAERLKDWIFTDWYARLVAKREGPTLP